MRQTVSAVLAGLVVACASAACGRGDDRPGETAAAGRRPTTSSSAPVTTGTSPAPASPVVTTRPRPPVTLPPTTLPPTTLPAVPACTTDAPTETAWVFEAYDFQARTATELWLAGYATGGPAGRPTVRSSRDSGASWQPLCWPAGVDARGSATMVRFGGKVGFISGAAGQSTFVLRTADGGATWETAATPAPAGSRAGFRDAAFVGDSNIWLGGAFNPGPAPGALYRSSDGGRTFTAATAPPGAAVDRISFPDKDYGWAAAGGRLWSSADGGATWAAVPAAAAFPQQITGAVFVDRTTGFVIGKEPNGSEGRAVLAATRDGGATWQRLLAEDDRNFRSVTFVDAQHGFLAGGHSVNIGTPDAGILGVVYATDDGGQTWELRAELSSRDVQTLSFLSPEVGYATVVNRPCLLRTADGGRNWAKQPLAGAAPGACEQQ